MKRVASVLLIGILFAGVVLPLALYGSLRPCEILRQDLGRAFRAAAGRMARHPESSGRPLPPQRRIR